MLPCVFRAKIAPMMLPPSLATKLDQIARQAVGRDWPLYAALIEHWADIVGPDYARAASPVKITFPHAKSPLKTGVSAQSQSQNQRRQGGILHVALPRGLTMEFSFLSTVILQRLNAFFGYNAIEKIAYIPRTAPPLRGQNLAEDDASSRPDAPPPPLPEALSTSISSIENNELKEALENLAHAVMKPAPAKHGP